MSKSQVIYIAPISKNSRWYWKFSPRASAQRKSAHRSRMRAVGEANLQDDVTTVEINDATGKAVVQDRSPLPPFVMIFQDILLRCARDRSFSGETRRVLDYILASVKMGNHSVAINQQDLAVELGSSQSNISRSINDLKKRKILIKGHRAGKGTIYKLNPNWVWRGEGKDNVLARALAPQPFFPGKVSSLDEKRKKKSA